MDSKLNIGCGNKDIKGYVNLDKYDYKGIDIRWDLDKIPLPFDDEVFDEIKAENIMEHVDYISLMKDLSRILKKGGILYIRVPHYTCRDAYADPTHKKLFANKTFSFFVKSEKEQDKEYKIRDYSTMKTKIIFEKRASMFWNYILERFVNTNESTKEYYERSFLSMFPATAIEVKLIK